MIHNEYEQKRRECWEHIKFALRAPNTDRKTFDFIFDRAYALCKQTETITQEDIEKAAEKFADDIRISDALPGVLVPMFYDMAKSAYLSGAQDFIGKQEKDADTVIQGWVARDSDRSLYVYRCKPERVRYINGNDGVWTSGTIEALNPALFPDLTWADEPIEVELTIKRKKK